MAAKEQVCIGPCGLALPLDEQHFMRHSETGEFLRTCRSCRNAKKRRDREARTSRHVAAPAMLRSPPMIRARKRLPKARRYVITYAQNATPVHAGFLASLKHYARINEAEIVVIPGRYHNPTSMWSRAAEHDDWWAEELAGYLFNGRLKLPHLTVFGDISIQPTAERPLSGFEVFAGQASAIFGHPRLQLTAVPTATRMARLFVTTGAVTVPNYTDSKSGKKAQAHHVIGAAVVEREGEFFFVRQINAEDDGSFIDLDMRYTPRVAKKAPRAAALVCGDIHDDKRDFDVLDATLYGEDSIAMLLQPEQIVYHDLLDFAARLHHHIHDPFDRYERALGLEQDSIANELDSAVEFIERTPRFARPVVVQSNHDDALDKWLKSADVRIDPINAMIYHKLWLAMLEDYEREHEFIPAFELYYKMHGKRAARFVRRDQEFKICNITCGFHGDEGLNGVRGSTQTYAKLGTKTIIGHHHTPAILDGCYQVGVTGKLDQRYNALPSSWMHSHCVIYANGKRTLIHVIDGKWRATAVHKRNQKAVASSQARDQAQG